MKHSSYWIAAALVAALGGGVIALSGNRQDGELPAQPAQPWTERVELVEATPFTLLEPATHHFRAEAPSYTEGTLIVLRTAPENLVPRQTAELVLYVGGETAARVNVGERSGHLVAIVPGTVDLATAPIFFGEAALPEQVTRAEAQRQLALAVARGARANAAASVAAVTAEPVVLANDYELHLLASVAIEKHSPDERDLIEGLRAPLAR